LLIELLLYLTFLSKYLVIFATLSGTVLNTVFPSCSGMYKCTIEKIYLEIHNTIPAESVWSKFCIYFLGRLIILIYLKQYHNWIRDLGEIEV